MYFPIGWPRYLSGGQGKKSNLKCVVCNRYRMLFAVLTETTVSIWHCKPCVEIVSYQRCHSSVASIGTNELAEWRQDSSMLAVTTTEGYLLIYQLEQDVKGDKGLNLYEYHQTKTNQGDANEVVPALRLTLKSNVNYKVPVTSMSCVHDELLVGLVDGRLEILSWENATEQRKSVALCDIPFSMDLNLSGTIIKERNIFPIQAVYSPFLEGFALVLSDGRVALVAMTQSAPGSPDSEDGETIESGWKTRGIWAPGVSNATCVAVNNKYRLLAFGTTVGDCKVFAIDDTTGSLTLSHTISLSPTQYPSVCKTVGAVMKMDWSPDGCVLALAWMKGGLSVWSVFGSCLFCTLASDRAHGSDGASNVQGTFRSLCWGVEGYSLWSVGTHTNPKKNAKTQAEKTQNDAENKTTTDKQKKGHRKSARRKLVTENGGDMTPSMGKTNFDLAQLLIIQFVKSALAMNPCMSNHCHVLMHSEDKIFISLGERPQTYSIVSSDASDRSFLARRNSSVQSNYGEIASQGIRTRQGSRGSPRRRSVPSPLSSPHRVSQSPPPTLSRIDQSEVATSASRADDDNNDEEDISSHLGSAVTNKQWTVIQFPLNYLPGNWPIRFTAVDDTGCFLAIAGNFGLAHYTVTSRKWKVFGNVMQEKDMVVTGGLTWWEDYVVVACYNLSENQDEVRLYPRLTNLDNSFACIRRVKSQILLVNIFQNLLILFTYDCRISIFVLAHDPKQPREAATIRFLQELSMARYVPYPTLVASVTLTALHLESALRRSSSSTSFSSRPQKETEVLIVNVAGRLLLLQGATDDDETPSGGTTDLEEPSEPLANERRQLRFTAPVVLASCVENIWTTQHKNRAKVHLTDALWLGCGGAGVRVWLPLFPPRHNRHGGEDGAGHRGFELQLLTARRITLAFALDSCYPLAVLFNEAVVLGVTSETLQGFDETLTHKNLQEYNTALQFSTIERTCEIYLHQILRQLLRRNLGYHALQLAATCQNLSCFPHVLELMLHEVLEEEATASEPIPDPLLPTVIKFLEEFPQYLQTVVHCARKTEIALWEYLFNSVGSPRELFEECLELGQLRTAASYLIILQNLELLAVARQDATRLFDQALHTQQWVLANEIARFLRAIGDGDACATPRHPTLLNANIYPAVTPGSHHNTPTEPDPAFKFSEERKTLMMRQYSVVPGLDTHTNLHQRRSSSKSAPPTPQPQAHPNVYSSASKGPQNTPAVPEDPQAPVAPPNTRRLTSRSYTESYFDLVPPAGTVTSPGGQSSSGGSSLSHPYVVGKYQTRQYHQDHHPMHRPLQHSASHPTSANGALRSKRFSGDKDSVSKEQTAAECAEHYFLDVILARQARKILSERRIHDLGTFAACVDFQLVPWLRKERSRACRVDDAVACLKALHTDFTWPLPTFFSSRSSRGSTASSGGTPSHSRSFHDLGSLQTKLGAIDVNASSMSPSRSTHFNTSPRSRQSALRYPSASGLSPKRHNAVASLDVASVGTDDDGGTGSGVLTVLSARETGSTLTLTTIASEMSEVSESSLNVEDSSFGATSEDVYGFIGNGINLDDKRGPARCEMKLQYLLELFLEALCLEWATLVCLMLRDPSNMARLVRSAKLADPVTSNDVDTVPLEQLQRTRDCLSQIDQWALKECPGYKAVLVSVRAHLQELYDVINAREIAHAEQQAFMAQQQLQSHGTSPNPITITSSSSSMNTAGHSTSVSVVPNITIDRSAWSSVQPSTQPTPTLANKSTVPVTKKRLPPPGCAQNLSSAPPSLHNGTEGSASSSEQDDDQSSVVTSLSRHEPLDDVTRTTVESLALLNQVDGDLAPHLPPAPVADPMSDDFQDGGEGNSELGSDSELYDSDEYAESQDEGTGCSVS